MRGRSAPGGGPSLYLYLLPSLVFLALSTYFPLGLSFFQWNVHTPEPEFVGPTKLRHRARHAALLAGRPQQPLYALGTIPTTMAPGLAAAVLVNRKMAGRGFYRVALFYPTMLPMVAAAMLWVWLFNPRRDEHRPEAGRRAHREVVG